MSVISLATVKLYLRVTHTSDNTLLQSLIDGAEDEALRFMNRDELPALPYTLPEDIDTETDVTTEAQVAPSVIVAICCLVKADYDAATADETAKLRLCAETKLMPYRTEMGV